jgi:hypothetical protein
MEYIMSNQYDMHKSKLYQINVFIIQCLCHHQIYN